MKYSSFLSAMLLGASASASALATELSELESYTCTSDEGWKYYYEIHAMTDVEMLYSRGHDNVLSGWEVTCFGRGLPILDFCRDIDRVQPGDTSKPHDKLRQQCAEIAAGWRSELKSKSAE